MARHVFVISRETPYLAEYMSAQFRDEDNVEVVVDRRSGRDRRATSRPVDIDRRAAADRRRYTEVTRQLKESFHALITIT